MNEEWSLFVTAVGGGLLLGTGIAILLLAGRWWLGKPLMPSKQPTPRWIWPGGMVLFGVMAVISVMAGLAVFATAFVLVALLYLAGFIRQAYRARRISTS